MLAMDVSGTMRGEPLAGKRALELVKDERHEPCVVTFGSGSSQGFTSNRYALENRIHSLSADAMKTRLYDGLQAALELCQRKRRTRHHRPALGR